MATFIFVLLFVFAIIAPTLMANSGHDEYWLQRHEEAKKAVHQAYEPDVVNITTKLNKEVYRTFQDLELSPLSKRHLLASSQDKQNKKGKKIYDGPCLATNPIDSCWRCQSNWHLNRKRLADCGLGFGYKATGGKHGEIYVVTDNSDDILNPKPGTLRWGVIQKQPLWIIFSRSMNIKLVQELMIQSHKTIDGRGVHVNIIKGAQITLQFVNNVIIHGIHIKHIVPGWGGFVRDAVGHFGIRTRSDGDGISVFGSTNIWIDHVSMSNCTDGLIDITMGSTAITISNSHFTDHNKVMLLGAHNQDSFDKLMQITVAFNHFGKKLIQRMPRVRYGFVHVVNNDYTHWEMYAIGGNQNPTIISQGNRFIAPDDINAKEITKREYTDKSVWKDWTWISDRDLTINGAFFVPSGDQSAAHKILNKFEHKATIDAVGGKEVSKITKFAGALNCIPGRPC